MMATTIKTATTATPAATGTTGNAVPLVDEGGLVVTGI